MIDDAFPDRGRDAVLPAPFGTIWADMTTLLRWRRAMVGVVRVELQLALWILAHDDSVRFCRYDKTAHDIVDVDRRQLEAHIDFLARMGDGARRPAKAPAPAKPKKQRTALGKILRRIRKAARRALLLSGRPATDASKAGRRALPPSPSKLRSGDVYISVGSDWDDNDLARLYRRKLRDGFRMLGICYDMIPIKFPHLAIANVEDRFARHVGNLAWVADHVLCISKCSEKDLTEVAADLQCPRPETSVIRLGSELHSRSAAGEWVDGANAVADAVAAPFILFVSTIERRKNHETLYKAWVRLIEAGCAVPNLVFAGMRGWGVDDFLSDLARDRRIHGRIHVLTDVSDAELAMLYERCLYTVYPSLYEGWGLPVIESFGFGKFCLCSNAGSLPEAGGDLAEYLDPWDVNAWIAQIRYFADHPEEIERRNQMVAQRFRPQSWHDTSRSIMLKARELLGPRPTV